MSSSAAGPGGENKVLLTAEFDFSGIAKSSEAASAIIETKLGGAAQRAEQQLSTAATQAGASWTGTFSGVSAAASRFSYTVGTEIPAASRKATVELQNTATLGGGALKEQLHGASQSVAVLNQSFAALGVGAPPQVFGVTAALSNLLRTGLNPIGLAIAGVTAAVGLFAAAHSRAAEEARKEEEEVAAAIARTKEEAEALAERLRRLSTERQLLQGGKTATGEDVEIAQREQRVRNLKNEVANIRANDDLTEEQVKRNNELLNEIHLEEERISVLERVRDLTAQIADLRKKDTEAARAAPQAAGRAAGGGTAADPLSSLRNDVERARAIQESLRLRAQAAASGRDPAVLQAEEQLREAEAAAARPRDGTRRTAEEQALLRERVQIQLQIVRLVEAESAARARGTVATEKQTEASKSGADATKKAAEAAAQKAATEEKAALVELERLRQSNRLEERLRAAAGVRAEGGPDPEVEQQKIRLDTARELLRVAEEKGGVAQVELDTLRETVRHEQELLGLVTSEAEQRAKAQSEAIGKAGAATFLSGIKEGLTEGNIKPALDGLRTALTDTILDAFLTATLKKPIEELFGGLAGGIGGALGAAGGASAGAEVAATGVAAKRAGGDDRKLAVVVDMSGASDEVARRMSADGSRVIVVRANEGRGIPSRKAG